MAMNNYSLSVSFFKKYVLLDQTSAVVYYNLAMCLNELAQLDEAASAYRQALIIKPNFIDALYNLANLLNEQQRYQASQQCYQDVLILDPLHLNAAINQGNAFQQMRCFKEAEESFLQAIKLQPNEATAYNNLGNLLFKLKRFSEAEACFLNALNRRQNYANACTNYSLLLLSQGRFEEGWQAHETRFHPNKDNRAIQPVAGGVKQWQGEVLDGKSLLVWPEQGFGDEIQFVRYLPLLKGRGVRRLVLVCKKPLQALFAQLECVDKVICIDDFDRADLQGVDYWVFIMSLPFHFKTRLNSIPAILPYLKVSQQSIDYWANFLPSLALNVGLER